MAIDDKISEQFLSRLQKLGPGQTVEVIIMGPKPECVVSIPEEKPDYSAIGRQAMQPILDYLQANNVQVIGTTPALRSVTASMTSAQVYALAEQQYVRAIFENQQVYLVRPV